MNIEELREYCISIKGVQEDLPFGPDILVFKVMGKLFLLSGLDNHPIQFNVKCDPEKAVQLREQFPCVLPGYHMNKKHWNTIISDMPPCFDSLHAFHSWAIDAHNEVNRQLGKPLWP